MFGDYPIKFQGVINPPDNARRGTTVSEYMASVGLESVTRGIDTSLQYIVHSIDGVRGHQSIAVASDVSQ